MSKARNTELQRVAAMARRISESPAWSKILDSTERRVRFEDGFIQGWFARNINAKPAPKFKIVGWCAESPGGSLIRDSHGFPIVRDSLADMKESVFSQRLDIPKPLYERIPAKRKP
jgi:hypothetical protein